MKALLLKFILLSTLWGSLLGAETCSFSADQETDSKKISILFIGNSHTYYNDLPKLVAEIGRTMKETWEIRTAQIAPGGAMLASHLDNPETLQEIRSGNWDYVVLQEQGGRPVSDPEAMFAAVKGLDQVIKSSGAKTILYMTWARKSDPGLISKLADSYLKAGELFNAKVAPVGLAFEECRKDYPEINLHDPDGSHASLEGSYLAACIIFSTITDQSDYNDIAGIDKEKHLALQKIAQEIILNYNSK